VSRGDGLTGGEADIMSLWDSGTRDVAAIAERTGYGSNYVQEVVSRYNVTERVLNSFDKMTELGSAALLAAIHHFHPETRRGVHP
jgi:hypothetical protein